MPWFRLVPRTLVCLELTIDNGSASKGFSATFSRHSEHFQSYGSGPCIFRVSGLPVKHQFLNMLGFPDPFWRCGASRLLCKLQSARSRSGDYVQSGGCDSLVRYMQKSRRAITRCTYTNVSQRNAIPCQSTWERTQLTSLQGIALKPHTTLSVGRISNWRLNDSGRGLNNRPRQENNSRSPHLGCSSNIDKCNIRTVAHATENSIFGVV